MESVTYVPAKFSLRLMETFSSLQVLVNVSEKDNFKKIAALSLAINIFNKVVNTKNFCTKKDQEDAKEILDRNLPIINNKFSHKTSIEDIVFFYFGVRGLSIYKTLCSLGYNDSANSFWDIFMKQYKLNDNTNDYGFNNFNM